MLNKTFLLLLTPLIFDVHL